MPYGKATRPLEGMGKFATVVIDPPWPLPMAATYIRRSWPRSDSLSKMALDYVSMTLGHMLLCHYLPF